MINLNIDALSALDEALKQITEYLSLCGIESGVVFDSKLVSCELLTNVLKHGHGKASMHVDIGDGRVVIEVKNNSAFVPSFPSSCPDISMESGRGLFLVNSLSDEVEATEDVIRAFLKF